MADIDSIISGVSGNTRYDFSTFGDPVKSYFDAKDQKAKNELRDAFKGGVPTNPDGSIDYGTMQKTLYQKGGFEQGNSLSGISARAGELEALRGADGQSQPQAIVSPPSANRSASTVVAPPLNKGGVAPQEGHAPQGPSGQPATVMTVLAAQGIPNSELEKASASVARQLGVDPTAPLNLQDPQVRNVLAPAVAQLKRMGIGQVAQDPNAPPQTIPPVGQAAPQAPVMAQAQPQGAPPQAAPQGFQPPPEIAAAQNDPILKRLTLLSASQDKSIAAAAKVRLESYLKNKEATTEMKNAAASGMTLQQYQEKQGELAASQAGATERAKTDVGEQQEYIKGGKIASDRLTTLNTIKNIIDSDKMALGFGADTALKVQMALKSLGVDVGDLSGPQAIIKLNAVLASESAKGVGARPTQFEFKTFLANNPGLSMDKAGNDRVIGIYSQLAKREVDLGRLARANQDNWSNWDKVVEDYDKKHPIKDPKSGRVITTDTVVAPGPKSNQPANTQQFSSPSDVHAAIAAGKLKSGDTFQDSNGKTRVVP